MIIKVTSIILLYVLVLFKPSKNNLLIFGEHIVRYNIKRILNGLQLIYLINQNYKLPKTYTPVKILVWLVYGI